MKKTFPNWLTLKSFQTNKLVNSTYIWLLIVPTVAKLFSKFEDTIQFKINSVTYTFDLVLPFSWQMFYLSALCFVIGNIIFLLCAPKIIKDFNGYGDFKDKGKLDSDIDFYMKKDKRISHLVLQQIKKTAPNFNSSANLNFVGSESPNKEYNANTSEKNKFWDVFNDQNISKIKARCLCLLVYIFGSLFFSYVVIENIYWTLKQIFQFLLGSL